MGTIAGVIASLVAGIALFLIVGLIAWDSNTGAIAANFAVLCLPAGLLIGIVVPIMKDNRLRQEIEASQKAIREHLDLEAETRRQQFRDEQLGYHKQLMATGENSLQVFESMPNHLHTAEKYLDQAEIEFDEGAFAPFWDCIENAANQLGQFDKGIRRIKENSTEYSVLIKKFRDTPPHFPLSHESVTKLAVASGSAQRMQVIVRKAQRDFHFATIYEQRKTNKILIAGFTNLANAINEMATQITASIEDLTYSVNEMTSTFQKSLSTISSQIDVVAHTASRHADAFSNFASQTSEREKKVLDLLDNIQRHRQPKTIEPFKDLTTKPAPKA